MRSSITWWSTTMGTAGFPSTGVSRPHRADRAGADLLLGRLRDEPWDRRRKPQEPGGADRRCRRARAARASRRARRQHLADHARLERRPGGLAPAPAVGHQ
jgi:hypothetical protein